METYNWAKEKATNNNLIFIVMTLLIISLGYSISIVSRGSLTERQMPSTLNTSNKYGNLPIYFAPNHGQIDRQVKYYAKGAGYSFYLEKDTITYSFEKSPAITGGSKDRLRDRKEIPEKQRYALKINFIGSNPRVALKAQDRQAAKINYLVGDPVDHKTDIPTYSQVTYEALYKGIDLTYKGDGKTIKYEFLVSPGANYQNIKLNYLGADSLALDKADNLIIKTPMGDLRDKKPHVYQLINGKRHVRRSKFIVDGQTVGFSVNNHDPAYPLVIDPGLAYSTFLGGTTSDYGYSIAVDASGNAYITGETGSSDFPATPGSYETAHNGTSNVFVTKLNSAGTSLIYSTFLGGAGSDIGYDIVLDASGNAFLTGETGSSDFPTTPGSYETTHSGSSDAFAAKLDSAGASLAYSTFLGGSASDYGYSIALDASGNAYLTGETWSSNFPTTPGSYETTHSGSSDAFAAKLDSAGTSLAYSTYLGGTSGDIGYGIVLDTSGNAYLTGETWSSDFPTTPGSYETTHSGSSDAFAAKLDSAGTSLAYSTFLGGTGGDYGWALAVDASGNAYVTGETLSSGFPTTPGSYETTYSGSDDVFITKLNSAGTSLAYSTYLGGTSGDIGYNIALDASGNVYLTGETGSSDFPTIPGSYNTTYNGNTDAFVTKLDPAGTSLAYSTFLGGTSGDFGWALAVDALGNAYVTGETGSSDFPTTPGSYETTKSGAEDSFVVKLDTTIDVVKPTGSISINSGATYAKSTAVTLNLSASDGSGSGVDKMRFKNDGGTWSGWETYKTTKSWTLPSANGTKKIWSQYKDKFGNESVAYSDTIFLDTKTPTVSLSTPWLSTYKSKTTTFRVTWKGGDPSPASRIATFDVQKKVHGGSWTNWLTNTTKRASNFKGSAGKNYYFRVRAEDRAGNVSKYSTVRRTIVPIDNNSQVNNHSGFGLRRRNTRAYKNTLRYTVRPGARITYRFRGRGVYFITTKAKNRSKAQIYIGKTLIRTINTYSASTRYRKVVFRKLFKKRANRTITIVNVGNKKELNIDALGVKE